MTICTVGKRSLISSLLESWEERTEIRRNAKNKILVSISSSKVLEIVSKMKLHGIPIMIVVDKWL
jgi:hypothetical protein